MSIFAFIFARGGSKGIPGKNIKMLGGKPMLAYSIGVAQNLKMIDKIFVSTDDVAIAEIAHQFGAEIIERPSTLAQDDSSEWSAWQHAVKYAKDNYGPFDVFVSLPATAPLRSEEDIKACISVFDEKIDTVITVYESANNPFFNMVKINQSGYATLFNDSKVNYFRRQDVPKAYNMTTVCYVTRPEFIETATGIFDGVVKAVEIPQDRAVDIDTPSDFRVAQCLIDGEAG